MAILSEVSTPDKFESHSSLKTSFTIIPGLRSNFYGWESFYEANSLDILGL